MSFENDPRRKQEIAGRPIADTLYHRIFGSQITIARMERTENVILDRRFGIDVKLTLGNGQILLGQEKFLSQRYASFRTVTVEYEQNAQTHELGDWYHLAPQFYLVGYFNGTVFAPWILLNWPNTVIETWRGQVPWRLNRNKDGRARASFKFCRMDDFPDSCVIAKEL